MKTCLKEDCVNKPTRELLCEKHFKRKKRLEYQKEYHKRYFSNPENIARKRAYWREYFKNPINRQRRKDKLTASRRKMRLAALTHYGGNPPKCACCGESHVEFLAIDHINGGGNKHRKQVKKTSSGCDIARWLRDNKYPKGFQVLCHNCNVAKGMYGACPHKKEEDKKKGV